MTSVNECVKYNITEMNYRINIHPKYIDNDNHTCKICGKSLYAGDVVVGKCRHGFHKACLNNSAACPIDGTIWSDEYSMSCGIVPTPIKPTINPTIHTVHIK